MLARAVAARDSEARPRAARGEVGARRAGLEERREGAEDWARGHGGGGGGGGGRSERAAAALRRAWGSAACSGGDGDGDGRDAVARQHSIGNGLGSSSIR
jgi:hypothetical protein